MHYEVPTPTPTSGGRATAVFPRGAEAIVAETAYPWWEKAGLAGLLVLTILLDCVHLPGLNAENTYYATAVKSMLSNWHNFFFVAFDSTGFLSVDKPPLGLWVMAASARLFGFSVIGLLLPEIVAGSLSVLLLYYLVRRSFGGPAGLLAGALLAITPINVVTNRDNIMDGLLVATSLASVWAILRAAEFGSMKWLALCALFIGIGFNIKMLEAYLIVPACVITYLAATGDRPLRLRLGQLLLFGVILVGISFTWVAAVDLTSAASRPYIDSTLTNREMDLVFNYNGLQRLVGQPLYGKKARPVSPVTGQAGPLRLLQPELAGQVSWLLPVALLGLLACNWGWNPRDLESYRRSLRRRLPSQGLAYLFWLTWLVTAGVFFSVARFFNLYYLVMFSPPVAALTGIGVIRLLQRYSRESLRWWLLPAAVLVTGTLQTIILSAYARWNPWLLPFVGLFTTVVAALLIVLKSRNAADTSGRQVGSDSSRPVRAIPAGVFIPTVAGLALAVLLVAPLSWLTASYQSTNEGGFPVSGPIVLTTTAVTSLRTDPKLINYLEVHSHGATFLVATVSVQTAIPIMWASGDPVMAMGGYSGYDPILSPTTLASTVRSGRVRLFLLPSTNLTAGEAADLYPMVRSGKQSFQTQYTNQLTRWVSQTCTPIPPVEWQTDPGLTAVQLFFCAGG
jgi:4-amino-4-deoxy-L-arabinose transferase-like glycosyltransferase